MCIESIQRRGETLAIRIGESLTEEDVRVVSECLVVKAPAADVAVDLRRMRMEEGGTMAQLLRVFERSGTPYSFVGLNSVQERVGRYLAPELVGRKRRAGDRDESSRRAPEHPRGVTMNENELPYGTALRRAVRWLSEQRSESPGAKVAALIEQASMRFDLSPLETNFLLDQLVRFSVPSGGTERR